MKSPDSIITRSEADALFRGEFVRGKRMKLVGYSPTRKTNMYIIVDSQDHILQYNLRPGLETFAAIRELIENLS